MKRRFIIGTRGSELALAQAKIAREGIAETHPGVTTELKTISTEGDAPADRPLSRMGSVGVFTKEIETALLDKRIDIAVHSLKDLPTTLPDGLTLAAIMKREDPRDVFLPRPGVAVKLASQLPAGSVIATGSLRRSAQVMGWKRGIKVADLRGNLQTRWQRLVESNWAGIILARAGVARLGWLERIGEVLDVNEMMPAVGQGSLAVEVRSDDNEAVELVACLEHDASRYAAEAERAWLRVLEGGCRVPVGALAQISNNRLTLSGLATSLDGTQVIRAKAAGDPDEAGEIGRRLAEVFLSSGADSILSNARAAQPAGLTL